MADDLMAARRLLLGPDPWLLETYEIRDGRLIASGWAVALHEAPEVFTFLANGRRPDVLRYPQQALALHNAFFFAPEEGAVRFSLEVALQDDDLSRGEVEIAFCDVFLKDPITRWHNVRAPFGCDRPCAFALARTASAHPGQ